MNNQKLENILNLALETPLVQRDKTLNLNVGFQEETGTWELIVKYNGDLSYLEEQGVVVENLVAGYAILIVPENLVDVVGEQPYIEYVEKPKRLFFSVLQGRREACINPVTIRSPFLTGAGVLVAVIDSGIDYTNRNFRNPDGTTRILYLWDQTIRNSEMGSLPPEGFSMGAEFTSAEINAALQVEDPQERFFMVPSLDVSGHGTAVAGIAAGNSDQTGQVYQGVALGSELIIVKLGNASGLSFPRTTELMRALTYVVRRAQEQQRPVAINLSFGNTYGSHDGTSLLERFIDNISEIGRNVICVGAGNEGSSAGHVQKEVTQNVEGGSNVEISEVELAVAEYESTLNVQLWKSYVDEFVVSLTAPDGQSALVPTLAEDMGKRTVVLGQTQVLIYQGQPAPYSVTQEIYFDFIPLETYINSGIWTFTVEARRKATGHYHFYLPSAVVRNSNTRFYRPTPDVTLTIPSTSMKVITVGAYDIVFQSYADFSGRGYAYSNILGGVIQPGAIKPDLVAPGVNIQAPNLQGGYTSVTGTSFATPFVTGAAALMMEWGIIRENDPYLYGEKVKAYLRNGAQPIRGELEYPNPRVGYGALCLAESLPI